MRNKNGLNGTGYTQFPIRISTVFDYIFNRIKSYNASLEMASQFRMDFSSFSILSCTIHITTLFTIAHSSFMFGTVRRSMHGNFHWNFFMLYLHLLVCRALEFIYTDVLFVPLYVCLHWVFSVQWLIHFFFVWHFNRNDERPSQKCHSHWVSTWPMHETHD